MGTYRLDQGTVLFRDGMVPFHKANLSIASSPVLYGLSVYTVFSANWNPEAGTLSAFRLRDHYDRLVNSAKIMDFHSFVEEWSWERFETAMRELLMANAVQEDVLVRVTIFVDELIAGTKIHGLKNSVSAYVYPMGEILPRSGINVCVSSWTRTGDNAIPSRAKINGSYVNASLMKNEALLNGFDDAIALDAHGHVSEGTVANLFLVKDGQLITPDDSTDILEGITRTSIISIARDNDITVKQRGVDRSELYTCDEAFMCGSSARVTPILSIDKRQVGSGGIGSVTARLSELYRQAQHGGDADRYASWRTQI